MLVAHQVIRVNCHNTKMLFWILKKKKTSNGGKKITELLSVQQNTAMK